MRSTTLRITRPAIVLGVAVTSMVASTLLGVGTARADAADDGIKVVADGLSNPRHLVADGNGDLYVAEAGRGAADPKHAPCIDAVNPETQEKTTYCYGPTGAITRIHGHSVRKVVTNLPSVADSTGTNAGGVTDLTVPVYGRSVAVVNLGADPGKKSAALPAPAVASAGHLLAVDTRRNRYRIGPDVSAYEAAHNPDGRDPGSGYDSNPYAVAAHDGSVVVADAGGNDLLAVDRNGHTRLLAVLHARLVDAPPFLGKPAGTKIPIQAVPSAVVQGPDGAWYVGELTGFPFVAGAARVWRVIPGHDPTVVASGFTNIIDLAFDKHGHLLVLEIAKNGLLDPKSPGALWRVGHHGSKTLVTSALTAPGGVAIGTDGYAYVTNLSTSPGSGQVLRISLNS